MITKGTSGTISIGDMRTKAQFQNNAPVSNNSGGFKDVYTTFYTCRGRFRQQSGNRQLEQGQLVNNRQFEFICRFTSQFSTMTADTRILIGPDSYAIKTFELVDQINHWYQFILSKNNT